MNCVHGMHVFLPNFLTANIDIGCRWLGRVVGGPPELSVLLPASKSGITLTVRACDAYQVSISKTVSLFVQTSCSTINMYHSEHRDSLP